MRALPPKIQRLIEAFTVLPGVGERTASRYALNLFYQNKEVKEELGGAISGLIEGVQACVKCGHLAEGELCQICLDPTRDSGLICVVENPLDIVALERMGGYRGYYHVLGGLISPLAGVGPDDLAISTLLERLKKQLKTGGAAEVVLATDPSLEGEATANYLAQLVKDWPGLKTTRIARGLPMGADLEYADEVTLARAFEGRDVYKN